MALVMAVGIMTVLSVSGTTVAYYSVSNASASNRDRGGQNAYALAEAGVNNAISVLANSSTPTSSTLLPSTTVTLAGGTATYSGALVGTVWTITSTGSAVNPAVPGQYVKRTLTRIVNIKSLNVGSLHAYWDRFYLDDISACVDIPSSGTVPYNIPVPFAARGNICLHTNTTLTGSKVAIGGNVTLDAGTSIGLSGTPITQADIGGTCAYNLGAAHTPCSATDHVYANTITSSPAGLLKPTPNFTFWWANAAPGPKHGCDVSSGTPPTFDNDAATTTAPNGSTTVLLNTQELAPAASYTCQSKDAAGNVIGELSWNVTTHVLTVSGTIFIDGGVQFATTTPVHYQGRGVIWAQGTNKGAADVCAGGTGTTTCHTTAAISNWDPTTNLLVMLSQNVNLKVAAYQGVLFSNADCKIEDDVFISGPMICNTLNTKPKDSTHYGRWFTWPALPGAAPGQVYTTGSLSDIQLIVGPQSG